MTKRNKHTRKSSLGTKMNQQEIALVNDAFYKSDYHTIGHFVRDVILDRVKNNQFVPPPLPVMNKEVATQLRSLHNSFSKLINHLDQALLDQNVFLSNRDKEKYLVESMQLVHNTSQKINVWQYFLTNNFSSSIQQIAFETLTIQQLQNLVNEKEKLR
ncbi:hypothetical protein SAMN05216262_103114 [Colwellia chukchiensis]|uniref:Uncharacterized protein n=1 Tax=Colwellia chukchiensis TaxID=641665 RepID=A0A1H7KE39_9GAMM|nr:hypothetical protein [Colwellia chukchiensis]CCQ10644.1 hypothetical protein PALB_15110 [Pseudoalteromonas luteoviolacea B = ATCC 29581]SEK85141.1 hypothetical protein SAMN05216262_103114 [Colwellia chukchiensis]